MQTYLSRNWNWNFQVTAIKSEIIFKTVTILEAELFHNLNLSRNRNYEPKTEPTLKLKYYFQN